MLEKFRAVLEMSLSFTSSGTTRGRDTEPQRFPGCSQLRVSTKQLRGVHHHLLLPGCAGGHQPLAATLGALGAIWALGGSGAGSLRLPQERWAGCLAQQIRASACF